MACARWRRLRPRCSHAIRGCSDPRAKPRSSSEKSSPVTRTMRRSARLYEFCGVTIASELPLPELLRSARTNAEWSIAVDTVGVSRVSAEWFREWRLPGGKLWLSIGRIPNGYLLRFRDYADFTICTNPNRIVVHPVDAHQETLRHLLIDQVLPLALSRRGHLVLHASAVHLPGVGAVGFVGATGRGKST